MYAFSNLSSNEHTIAADRLGHHNREHLSPAYRTDCDTSCCHARSSRPSSTDQRVLYKTVAIHI